MTAQPLLRKEIDERVAQLRSGMPANHEDAILALVRTQNGMIQPPVGEPAQHLVTGHRIANFGSNLAPHLCLLKEEDELATTTLFSSPSLDAWARSMLAECASIAEAEQVLEHCETGFMRLVEADSGAFEAWIASKHPPARWRERMDFDWWSSWNARVHEEERRGLLTEIEEAGEDEEVLTELYRELARVHVDGMEHQLGYPPDVAIGGCSIHVYVSVLIRLIATALHQQDRGLDVVSVSEQSLVDSLSADLDIDPFLVATAIENFTVDRNNSLHHAAVPGIAAAPIIGIAPDRLVLSLHGLTSEPLIFLTQELRRRDSQEYHNTAHLREDVFRQDLYSLFQDKRFVTSTGRVVVRREGGDLRTDIDAVVFDKKTGTLGIFELKSQDPFARSTAALIRQRDNLMYANRQVSGILDWLKRHGANDLLGRVDSRTAKMFRAQKVYPFVLGRYLAHFGDGNGAQPDQRAAWGSWPQVLRLLDDQPIRPNDANPIASLFNRLVKDPPSNSPPTDAPPHVITLGPTRLTVHASYAGYQGNRA